MKHASQLKHNASDMHQHPGVKQSLCDVGILNLEQDVTIFRTKASCIDHNIMAHINTYTYTYLPAHALIMHVLNSTYTFTILKYVVGGSL